MSKRRVGIWLVGANGGVGSTAALGLAAIQRGLADTTSLVTALPLFNGLSLDPVESFVVGGHEIRKSSFLEAVQELHDRAGVFDVATINGCREQLEAWQANVVPGTTLGAGLTISKLADLPGCVDRDRTAAQAIERFKGDLRAFKENNKLDQVVVVCVASTEPPFEITHTHHSLGNLRGALETPGVLPASSLYAFAALDLGMAFVNFTPSLGASCPALRELAEVRKAPIAGQDGKTGETLMKSVLAPMFAHRNWQILSWVGHNIFGNRDGLVLDDPHNKSSKIKTKDQVITEIVGYKPNTHVSIEYIPDMDDWKTAWDHIHFKGFLGTRMVLQFIWQGCDSLLAAPLVIDLCRLTLFAQREGEVGILPHLACFFKNPNGVAHHDFFVQWEMLRDYVEKHTLAGADQSTTGGNR
jgi:myo-inositol-1-phosphate synthase